jgi:hypothetical protein
MHFGNIADMKGISQVFYRVDIYRIVGEITGF